MKTGQVIWAWSAEEADKIQHLEHCSLCTKYAFKKDGKEIRSKMWCWRSTWKIKWADKITNEDILQRVNGVDQSWLLFATEKLTGLDTVLEETAYSITSLSEK